MTVFIHHYSAGRIKFHEEVSASPTNVAATAFRWHKRAVIVYRMQQDPSRPLGDHMPRQHFVLCTTYLSPFHHASVCAAFVSQLFYMSTWTKTPPKEESADTCAKTILLFSGRHASSMPRTHTILSASRSSGGFEGHSFGGLHMRASLFPPPRMRFIRGAPNVDITPHPLWTILPRHPLLPAAIKTGAHKGYPQCRHSTPLQYS